MNTNAESQIVHHRSGWGTVIFGFLLLIGGIYMMLSTWWGAGISAIGVLLFIFARWVTLVVDKNSQKVTISTRGLFFSPTVRSHPFSSIKEIVVEESEERQQTSDGNNQRKVKYILNFHKHNGEMDAIEIKLSSNFNLGGIEVGRMLANNNVMRLANDIAETIGVPCKVDRDGRIDILQAIDAISNAVTSHKTTKESVSSTKTTTASEEEKAWGSK